MRMRMRIEAIAIGDNPPDDVNVIVEVPVGSQPIKYELDKDAGVLIVDRFLFTPMAYPGNYGFVPHTLCEDGDPIDVVVCNTRQLLPGCVVNVRPSIPRDRMPKACTAPFARPRQSGFASCPARPGSGAVRTYECETGGSALRHDMTTARLPQFF